jgi:hypothetical protein
MQDQCYPRQSFLSQALQFAAIRALERIDRDAQFITNDTLTLSPKIRIESSSY